MGWSFITFETANFVTGTVSISVRVLMEKTRRLMQN